MLPESSCLQNNHGRVRLLTIDYESQADPVRLHESVYTFGRQSHNRQRSTAPDALIVDFLGANLFNTLSCPYNNWQRTDSVHSTLKQLHGIMRVPWCQLSRYSGNFPRCATKPRYRPPPQISLVVSFTVYKLDSGPEQLDTFIKACLSETQETTNHSQLQGHLTCN